MLADYVNEAVVGAGDVFRNFGVDTYLPKLKVYGTSSSFVHLSPLCGDGTEAEKDFLDVKLQFCDVCDSAPEANRIKVLAKELIRLKRTLNLLNDIDTSLRIVPGIFMASSKQVGYNLSKLSVLTTTRAADIEGSKVLYPVADMIRMRAEDAKKGILEYLRTNEAKEALVLETRPSLNRHIRGWVGQINTALVERRAAYEAVLTLAEAFGTEIVSDKFLVQGPTEVLSYLFTEGKATKMFIPEGTPAETIEVMMSLWEPGSPAAMGDPFKALAAAHELIS